MKFYVYMLYSQTLRKNYYGYTSNIQQRLSQHNRSKKGFTAVGKPWVLIGYSEFETKTEAKEFESYLKRLRDASMAFSKLEVQLL